MPEIDRRTGRIPHIGNEIRREKPEGVYCQVTRMFGESVSCPWLDESKGARHPLCLKLNKNLSWDRAGHILKGCEN